MGADGVPAVLVVGSEVVAVATCEGATPERVATAAGAFAADLFGAAAAFALAFTEVFGSALATLAFFVVLLGSSATLLLLLAGIGLRLARCVAAAADEIPLVLQLGDLREEFVVCVSLRYRVETFECTLLL